MTMPTTWWFKNIEAYYKRNRLPWFTMDIPAYFILAVIVSMLPVCIYLYKDGDNLQKIVRLGKNLKRAIYPSNLCGST